MILGGELLTNLTSGRFIGESTRSIPKMSLYFVETNFWDDFDWFVWTKGEGGSSGRSGCKFESFYSSW